MDRRTVFTATLRAGFVYGLLWASGTCASENGGGGLLVADLSSHQVAITTGFDGTTLLLFGAIENGGDVVVVVRGPAQTQLVRRRGRLAGLWVNRAQALIGNAPVFYQMATTRPLEAIASSAELSRHRIGLDHLNLTVKRADRHASDDDYRKAFVRLKQRIGLYGEAPDPVTFVGATLFRADMTFPANVPTGQYTVDVFLVRDGAVAEVRSTPLTVVKTGIDAQIFDVSRRFGALYGVFAVGLAIGLGWTASAVFRRR